MLVLKRKVGETIKIGDSITVRITEIKDNRVKIGVEAPHEVLVLRGELEKHSDENKEKE